VLETSRKISFPQALRVVSEETGSGVTAGQSSGMRVLTTALGSYGVELWGAMPVGWLCNFTRGATRSGLDIARGSARRDARGIWFARFELHSQSGDAQDIDYLALGREKAPDVPLPPLLIEAFTLEREADRPGALALRVRAHDRVGLLASLLDHVAGFVLFPEQILIETLRGEAHDVLWLSSVGGEAPPTSLETALQSSLSACLNRRISYRPLQ